MRAILMDAFGGADALRVGDTPTPEPQDGEVLVRVDYAGINPADWKTREGMLERYIEYSFPFILGFDFAGEVAALGAGVTGLKVGDPVFGTSMQGMGRNGSYAQYVVALPSMLVPAPKGLSLAALGGVPTAAITAYGGMVDAGELKAGQKVLINGGAGGVGTFAIQIARALGAEVAVTCGPDNLDYVRDLGASLAINYRKGDVHGSVAEWAPDGVDLILDAVGQDSLLPGGISLVRSGGRYVEIETLISEADALVVKGAAQQNVTLVSNMIAIMRAHEHLQAVADLLASGAIQVPEPEVIAMADIGAAHERIRQGHVRGKIVIAIDHEGSN